MIILQDEYLTVEETLYLIGLWGKNLVGFSSEIIRFFAMDLKNSNLDISCIQDGLFNKNHFHKIRLQKYNEEFKQIEDFHGHENIHNYIIFLNDDFSGGELEFENGSIIKPKRGSLVYFNNNERHRVKECIGDRFVFTALGDKPIDIKWQTKIKSII